MNYRQNLISEVTLEMSRFHKNLMSNVKISIESKKVSIFE
jgi:hypothetical protein